MDPLFVATPSEADISRALSMWPELTGKRLRPVLITAFGDIYVELETGEVMVADPIGLNCSQIAANVHDLEKMFADGNWAQERLMANLALLAKERGLSRQPHQVFAVSPHPCFTGNLQVGQLLPMDLHVWHSISTQLRSAQ